MLWTRINLDKKYQSHAKVERAYGKYGEQFPCIIMRIYDHQYPNYFPREITFASCYKENDHDCWDTSGFPPELMDEALSMLQEFKQILNNEHKGISTTTGKDKGQAAAAGQEGRNSGGVEETVEVGVQLSNGEGSQTTEGRVGKAEPVGQG